jgi:UDP-N-acetylmuramate-alanine ligase
MKDAVARLKKDLKSGDILLTLGAGDVWKVGEQVLQELK